MTDLKRHYRVKFTGLLIATLGVSLIALAAGGLAGGWSHEVTLPLGLAGMLLGSGGVLFQTLMTRRRRRVPRRSADG